MGGAVSYQVSSSLQRNTNFSVREPLGLLSNPPAAAANHFGINQKTSGRAHSNISPTAFSSSAKSIERVGCGAAELTLCQVNLAHDLHIC